MRSILPKQSRTIHHFKMIERLWKSKLNRMKAKFGHLRSSLVNSLTYQPTTSTGAMRMMEAKKFSLNSDQMRTPSITWRIRRRRLMSSPGQFSQIRKMIPISHKAQIEEDCRLTVSKPNKVRQRMKLLRSMR